MIYTYEYRDKSGKISTGSLEAASRKECFEKLQGQNINPITVTEKKALEIKADKFPASKTVLFSLLLLSLAAVGFFVFSKGEAKPERNEKKTLRPAPAQVKPDLPKEEKTAVGKEAFPRKTATVKKPQSPKDVRIPNSNIYTNSRGEEVRVAKDGTRTAMLTAWARKREEAKKNPPKRIFKHTSEAYMALFLNPAQPIPPPPENYSKEHVEAMLNTEIAIDPATDTEEDIRMKEGVIELKNELRQWLKEGKSFGSFLDVLQKKQNEEASKMFEARRMITEEMEKGNFEEAKKMYDEINRHFADEHMPPVRVAPKYRKLLDGPKKQ